MSEASKRARAERRAAESEPEGAPLRAVALLPDSGGYRVVVMAVPRAAAEAYAVSVSEAEVLSIQAPIAAQALEDGARGDLDAEGRTSRPTCPACKCDALVRHPTKPAWLCASCGARHPVEAVQEVVAP